MCQLAEAEGTAGGPYCVGDHGSKHRPVQVVSIELAHQDGDHGEFNGEDDCVEKRLHVHEYVARPGTWWMRVLRRPTYLPQM